MNANIPEVRSMLIDSLQLLSQSDRDYGEICTELSAAVRQVYSEINNGGEPLELCDKIVDLSHELAIAVRRL